MWDWNAAYWLASREVTEDTYGGCYFSMRYVGNDLDFFDVSELNWAGYVYGNSPRPISLRPCISLNPNVKVVGGGDGSEEAQAYELGI